MTKIVIPMQDGKKTIVTIVTSADGSTSWIVRLASYAFSWSDSSNFGKFSPKEKTLH
jgi:hypothetical protein